VTSVAGVRSRKEDPEAVRTARGERSKPRQRYSRDTTTLCRRRPPHESQEGRGQPRSSAAARPRVSGGARRQEPQTRRQPQGRRPIRAATWIDRPGWPPESPVTLAGDGALRFFSFAPPETHGRVTAVEHGHPRPAWLSWSWRPLQRSCCHTCSALVASSAPPSPFETASGSSSCNPSPGAEAPEDPLLEFASPSEPNCVSAARAPVSSRPLARSRRPCRARESPLLGFFLPLSTWTPGAPVTPTTVDRSQGTDRPQQGR